MNDIREMVRADLAARLKATVKRRRPKPKGMLQRAAIAAAHVDVDEDVVDEDVVDEDVVDEDDVASEIRDARLYRQTHGTFEDYCKERWGMHRSRAYRFIEAAETVEALSPIGDTLPATESQARPLTKLEREAQRQAWTQSNRGD